MSFRSAVVGDGLCDDGQGSSNPLRKAVDRLFTGATPQQHHHSFSGTQQQPLRPTTLDLRHDPHLDTHTRDLNGQVQDFLRGLERESTLDPLQADRDSQQFAEFEDIFARSAHPGTYYAETMLTDIDSDHLRVGGGIPPGLLQGYLKVNLHLYSTS